MMTEPLMFVPSVRLVPFFCHWKKKGGVPVPSVVKDTVEPTPTVWFDGCSVNTGGKFDIVRTAVELVAEPVPEIQPPTALKLPWQDSDPPETVRQVEQLMK